MSTAAKRPRAHRTITGDFRDAATYFQRLGDGQAWVECVCAFLLGSVTLWWRQCPTCQAVCTVLPHLSWRYRQMRPEVAREALVAPHGGLSLALCAVLYPLSPMALYRLICAFGHQSLGSVLTRCGLPLPVYGLADEQHSRALTAQVSLPPIVCGRVLWPFGDTDAARTTAFPQSYHAWRCFRPVDLVFSVRGGVLLTNGVSL